MSNLPSVVICASAPEQDFTPLQGLADIILPTENVRILTQKEVIRYAKDKRVEGLIIPGEFPVDAEFLNEFPHLKVIANTAAGYNNLPLEELTKRGIWATNTPSAFVDATADATLGMLLSIARFLPLADQFVRNGKWHRTPARSDQWAGMELRGKTIGIVGFGRTGQAVASRAEAFGMKVIYTRRGPKISPSQRDLKDLLAEADVVTLHVPLTDETRHLINRETLSKMRPGSILINMARGPVVNEKDLIAALRDGPLGAAALDVFEDEPRVSKELFGLANVVLAPHLGGATRESRSRARRQAAQNIACVLQDDRPDSPVNDLGTPAKATSAPITVSSPAPAPPLSAAPGLSEPPASTSAPAPAPPASPEPPAKDPETSPAPPASGDAPPAIAEPPSTDAIPMPAIMGSKPAVAPGHPSWPSSTAAEAKSPTPAPASPPVKSSDSPAKPAPISPPSNPAPAPASAPAPPVSPDKPAADPGPPAKNPNFAGLGASDTPPPGKLAPIKSSGVPNSPSATPAPPVKPAADPGPPAKNPNFATSTPGSSNTASSDSPAAKPAEASLASAPAAGPPTTPTPQGTPTPLSKPIADPGPPAKNPNFAIPGASGPPVKPASESPPAQPSPGPPVPKPAASNLAPAVSSPAPPANGPASVPPPMPPKATEEPKPEPVTEAKPEPKAEAAPPKPEPEPESSQPEPAPEAKPAEVAPPRPPIERDPAPAQPDAKPRPVTFRPPPDFKPDDKTAPVLPMPPMPPLGDSSAKDSDEKED